MDNLKILDLISQKDAVKSIISSLSEEESLNWLKSKGDLKEISSGLENATKVYCFTSAVGIETRIFFHDGELTIIGDHYAF